MPSTLQNLYRRDVNHGPPPIFPLNEPKKRATKRGADDQPISKPSLMNSAAGSNFTTYRNKRLEQKLSEIAAEKVPLTTKGNTTKRPVQTPTTTPNSNKVLLISQPMTIKVPKQQNKKVIFSNATVVPDNMVPLRINPSPSQPSVTSETTKLTITDSTTHLVPVNSSSTGQDLTIEQQTLLADLIPKRNKETAKFDQIKSQLNQVLDLIELSSVTPDQLNQLIHLAKTRFSMMAKN